MPDARSIRPPKGDPDAQWSHDLYEDPDKPSLSSRLTSSAAPPRKPDSLLIQRALREATAAGGLSIKGASTGANGNVVQVDGLVKGTSAADVEADDAATAVSKFDKQPADGRILRVSIVGVQSVGLSGRLGGVDIVNENGSVDVLMGAGADDEGGSKMRSDSIMNSDPRASVLVSPPGTDSKAHNQRNNSRPEVPRYRGGRRGGRGRRGGGRGGGSGMDVD
ncbi:hypothetical protein BU15DRAFT_72318 [Melanogaster broomeanus]|nr:hypothetical protein BU15DRAFT_72318 [Melanogaster broomeanus]